MLGEVVSVLLPIISVLALGYAAGRAKAFDADQLAGLNELVLTFALPASLFVGTVKVSRSALLDQGPLLLALFVSTVGVFVAAYLLDRRFGHHDMSVAALRAMTIAFAAGPFFGPALLEGVYGPASVLAISLQALVLNVVVVPATMTLLGVGGAASGGGKTSAAAVLRSSLVNAAKTPFVWAPVLAIILVLVGFKVPKAIDNSFLLIGSATSGVAIFVAGATLAGRKIRLSRAVALNVAVKMLLIPALYAVIALGLDVQEPTLGEGLLLSALPTGAMAVLLATRYKQYEDEASSSLAISTFALIITLPIALALVGA